MMFKSKTRITPGRLNIAPAENVYKLIGIFIPVNFPVKFKIKRAAAPTKAKNAIVLKGFSVLTQRIKYINKYKDSIVINIILNIKSPI